MTGTGEVAEYDLCQVRKEEHMDISGMTSAYSDLAASSAQTSRLEGTLKGDYSKAKDEELMDACKKFEAYFLEQVFKEMQKTVPKSEDREKNTLMEFFEDQYVQEIAADSTDRSSLGLAQMLFEQMKRNCGLDPSVVSKPEDQV